MRVLPVLMGLMVGSSAAHGQGAAPPSTLQHTLDSVVAAAMDSVRVPGVVIAIVRRDSVLALRGYGYAQLEDSVAADPVRSIYRLASVAKLFVAAAVLQRVTQGRLDLEQDVRTYAPNVPIPPGDDAPITLRHLLTHTAGFDERMIGYGARTRADMRPLGEYLAARLPDRGWAPGAVIGYSNHGMAFAGYVAEREAGESFAALAARTVFAPLGMAQTFYIEPPDDSLGRAMAPGYRCGQSGCERAPMVWSHAYPVGLAFSTASDMSRFMRAWLAGGMLEGQRVIDSTTVTRAMSQQFTHDPRVPGIGFAFFEQSVRGHRLLTHAGGAPGTATVLALAPSDSLGVFIATNAGEPTVTRMVLESVLAALLPDATGPPPVANGPVAEYAGNYRLTRYSHRTIERFPGVFAFNATVRATGDTLRIPAGTRARRFVRIDSLLLQEVSDGTLAALRRDASGTITMLFTGVPTGGAELPGAFERLPWYEGAYFLNEYVSALAGVPLIVLALWSVVSAGQWVWRRRVTASLSARGASPKQAWMAIAFGVCFTLLFIAYGFGFIAAGSRQLSRNEGMTFGMTSSDIVTLRVAWLLAIAAIPMVWFAVIAWRGRWWDIFGRLSYSVLALGAVLVAHFLIWFQYVPGRW